MKLDPVSHTWSLNITFKSTQRVSPFRFWTRSIHACTRNTCMWHTMHETWIGHSRSLIFNLHIHCCLETLLPSPSLCSIPLDEEVGRPFAVGNLLLRRSFCTCIVGSMTEKLQVVLYVSSSHKVQLWFLFAERAWLFAKIPLSKFINNHWEGLLLVRWGERSHPPEEIRVPCEEVCLSLSCNVAWALFLWELIAWKSGLQKSMVWRLLGGEAPKHHIRFSTRKRGLREKLPMISTKNLAWKTAYPVLSNVSKLFAKSLLGELWVT